MRSTISFAGLLVVALSGSGCAACRSFVGRDTIDLSHAQVNGMKMGVRRPGATICPRAPVQMAVLADLQLAGENAPRQVETYEGGEASSWNGRMTFDEFAFSSLQGRVDQNGFFSPDPDVIRTASTGFVIRGVYRRQPDKLNTSQMFRPDYACIRSGGARGQAGDAGAWGVGGAGGAAGSDGSNQAVGGDGSAGSPGSPGGNGGEGGPGPLIEAKVAIVRTRFYDKLLAVRLSGAVTDLLLAPAGEFTFFAQGGAGGSGGSGGGGGGGGAGGHGVAGGRGGAGGAGGPAGLGGSGGAGGRLVVQYDETHPEIASMLRADVSGGEGGSAGPGGPGGSGGNGGNANVQGGAGGAGGPNGPNGSSGSRGPAGRAGDSSITAGEVRAAFQNIEGVTLL